METKKVYLLPGELYVSKEPAEIATLLGSCVSICLYNKMYRFGGMNHFMLSRTLNGEPPSGKHGDYSSSILIDMMLSYDSNIRNITASVIGGGNVNGHLSMGTSIGANNIVTAFKILEHYKIPVINKNIGGDFGRKLYFKNWTNEIEVRKIEKSNQSKIIEAKKQSFNDRKIKVLIVDDSPTIRDIIRKAISADAQIEVVGGASNPYEAREMLLEFDPDVICLDIIMPKMDGITFLKKIIQYAPKPVIIISTVAQKDSKLREQARKIGAVEIIDKEELQLYNGLDVVKSVLVSKIKSCAGVWLRKKTKEELDLI